MKNRIISAILATIMVLGLAACGSGANQTASSTAPSNQTTSAQSTPEQAAPGKKISIFIMPKLVGIDYYNVVKLGVDEAAEELKDVADITWLGPTEFSVEKQIEMLETIIPQKPDVICVAANDFDALVPVFKEAAAGGTKIVTWDSDASYRDFFVNLVDYDMFGFALIASLAEQIDEKGDIAIITTSFTTDNHVRWIDAINRRIEEKYPDINVADIRPAGEDTQKANQITQDFIKTIPNLRGVITMGAPNLLGAVEAVKSAGKVGEVIVEGNSTPNIMKQHLKDGSIRDVLLWPVQGHGYLTCYSAYRLATEGLAEGKAFEAGSMGSFTPVKDDISLHISLPIQVFTKDNVDDFDF